VWCVVARTAGIILTCPKLQDALFISTLLADDVTARAPISERATRIANALKVYKTVQGDRGKQVQVCSLQNGMRYDFRGLDGEGDDLDAFARKHEDHFPWLWKYDTAGQLAKAVEQLKAM